MNKTLTRGSIATEGNSELQSAYRPHHSTETAVLKVLADILRAVDGGDLAVLALLDLAAAFDTWTTKHC